MDSNNQRQNATQRELNHNERTKAIGLVTKKEQAENHWLNRALPKTDIKITQVYSGVYRTMTQLIKNKN